MDADVPAVFDCRGELSEEQTARLLPARTREWSLWPSPRLAAALRCRQPDDAHCVGDLTEVVGESLLLIRACAVEDASRLKQALLRLPSFESSDRPTP